MENSIKQNNPLAGFFRQPEIYIKLPSKGKFWPEGTLELNLTGELPIYPMTTKDEITIKTPDALLNGQGMIDVIHSCCPGIKDAWKMPSCDADTILLALRIATYGNNADFNTKCPNCGEEHSYTVDLSRILDSIEPPDYEEKITIGEIDIKLKPVEYAFANQANTVQFEESRLNDVILAADMPEDEKLTRLKESVNRITDLNIELLARSTDYIEIRSTGQKVDDFNNIIEFYRNVPASVNEKINKQIANFGKQVSIKAMQLKCDSCGHEYETTLDFDFSSFFASGF